MNVNTETASSGSSTTTSILECSRPRHPRYSEREQETNKAVTTIEEAEKGPRNIKCGPIIKGDPRRENLPTSSPLRPAGNLDMVPKMKPLREERSNIRLGRPENEGKPGDIGPRGPDSAPKRDQTLGNLHGKGRINWQRDVNSLGVGLILELVATTRDHGQIWKCSEYSTIQTCRGDLGLHWHPKTAESRMQWISPNTTKESKYTAQALDRPKGDHFSKNGDEVVDWRRTLVTNRPYRETYIPVIRGATRA
jgi:hypothetical protein